MIHHIKCVAVFLFLLLFISCSGNTLIEKGEIQSKVVHQLAEERQSFDFFKSFQFCDNPYAAFTQEEANSVYQSKKIYLDKNQDKEQLNWSSHFHEGALQCIEEELGEHNSSYVVSTKEESAFDKLVVYNEKYVLIAQDGFFFAFIDSKEKQQTDKSSSQGKESSLASENNLKSIMLALQEQKAISLPVEYSYDFILELDGFKAIDPEMIGLNHLSDFQFAKLQSNGEFNLLLVAGSMESGQTELYLFTLDDDFNKIDQLLLYTSREIEEGSVTTQFKIDEKLTIAISEVETKNRKKTVLNEKVLRIFPEGNFMMR